ncbi:MAG: hypothetical protein P9M05_00015 [Candidatus Stygibacter australis]|nr:hypothetical protein [Candidatus Stygibacter australis]
MKKIRHFRVILCILAIVLLLGGCATFPKPNEIVVPKPIQGNSGKYMCPYTSDGTVTPWVEKGMIAKLGADVGGYLGKKAGEEALKNVPFVGGFLGNKVGEAAGREAAIALVGGRDFIKENSDLSFSTIDDLIVYLYANYTNNEHWQKVYDLTKGIYPKLEKRWESAIKKARKV